MKPTTAIAISGGVDSFVAAYLLKEKGHNVVGIHFRTGYETQPLASQLVSRIADQIGIPINILDIYPDFKKKIVDYFIATYLNGKTPNPCLVCNPAIKFGTVLNYAKKLGSSYLATGHYARLEKDRKGRFHLLKGMDHDKDQSYFLAFMSQGQLAKTCFPIGDLKKTDVTRLAREKGFTPVLSSESQDICFIKGKTYADFIALQKGFEPKPGFITDMQGNRLGEHNGLHLFTIGQRRGINCPSTEPYYVVRIDLQQNHLVVGSKEDLLTSECSVTGINWINDRPISPVKVDTRLRYRHKAVTSTLYPDGTDSAIISFETPQAAITPGQGAVFYQGDEVLGGGWLTNETQSI
jgi:tRNA-specific 2-thiouridylase